jgi:hypothetical protein
VADVDTKVMRILYVELLLKGQRWEGGERMRGPRENRKRVI